MTQPAKRKLPVYVVVALLILGAVGAYFLRKDTPLAGALDFCELDPASAQRRFPGLAQPANPLLPQLSPVQVWLPCREAASAVAPSEMLVFWLAKAPFHDPAMKREEFIRLAAEPLRVSQEGTVIYDGKARAKNFVPPVPIIPGTHSRDEFAVYTSGLLPANANGTVGYQLSAMTLVYGKISLITYQGPRQGLDLLKDLARSVAEAK